MTRTASSTKAPARATALFGCGLVILTVSLLFIPMNLRDVCILLNRGDYVRDEFEVDYFSQGRKSHTLGGHVVSTGETLSTGDEHIIIPGGLARRRQLLEEKKLVGHRFAVWYLPGNGFWRFVDKIIRFRVISPEEFDEPADERLIWLAVGAAFWLTGGMLLGWGVRIAKRASSRIIGLCLMLTAIMPVHGSAASATPAAVAEAFYTMRIASKFTGLPDKHDLDRMRPMISDRLYRSIRDARAHQKAFIAQHPDEKPPWIEGDLFSSLFEGPQKFQITTVAPSANGANVSVHFGYEDAAWDDVVVVVKQRGQYVIDDVEYGGAGDFNPRGRLSETLKVPITVLRKE